MSGLIDQLTVNYGPPGPVSKAFLESSAFVRGIRGPFGSGKSTVCCADILDHIVRQKRAPDGKRYSRHAIIRQTYPELKTTTIKTWHDMASPRLGRWIDQGPPTHVFQADDLDAEVMFLALDSPADVKKLLSMDLTTAWINEGREAPKAVLDGLTARVGRYPPQALGGPSWFGVTMDTNPPDADHWWYRLAEEQRPQGYEFFSQPSGLSPLAENVHNLPPGYYERMCQGKSADWIKVYVKGEYGFVLDGRAVFPEYSDAVHCQPFELAPGLPLYVGIDFGLTPAAAIGQKDAVGRWRWRYELTTEHMGALRFGELLAAFLAEKCPGYKFAAITGDPAGAAESQADESTPFKMLKVSKINAVPAETNDPTVRREAVASSMNRLVDGQVGFLIHPDMRVARKGFQGGYQYRRIQIAGDDRFHDKPDKNLYSHICESIEYGMLGGGEGRTVLGRKGPSANRPKYAIT